MSIFEFLVQGGVLAALLAALVSWRYQHRAEKIREKRKLVEETGALVTGWHNSLLELHKHAELTENPNEILINSRFYTWTRYYLPRLRANIKVLESESQFPECVLFVEAVKRFCDEAFVTCKNDNILDLVFVSNKLPDKLKSDLVRLRNLSHELITKRAPYYNQINTQYDNVDALFKNLTDKVEAVAELEGNVLAEYYLTQSKWYK